MSEELLTPAEVATMLQFSRQTVYGWLKSGKLPHIKLGPRTIRIYRHELDRFLEAHKYEPESPVP